MNGKMNGYGKEYNKQGEVKFEGEFINSIRNGYGKEYGINGEIKYEGQFINGKKINLNI